MELRHLRYFAVVAETCHFGQAAERLQMAQPPLSQQIRQLEAELGIELLARTTRSVKLTPAGEVFLLDARRILRSVDEAARRARRFADGKAGPLRIGLTGTASYSQLPVLARLAKRATAGRRRWTSKPKCLLPPSSRRSPPGNSTSAYCGRQSGTRPWRCVP